MSIPKQFFPSLPSPIISCGGKFFKFLWGFQWESSQKITLKAFFDGLGANLAQLYNIKGEK